MNVGPRHLALAAAGAFAGAGVAAQACIVVPPPDLASAPVRPPRILHDSVSPPADGPLANWPDVFIVPLEMDDPDPILQYDVVVGPGQTPVPRELLPLPPLPTDAGLVRLQFTIDRLALNIDLGICHTIRTHVSDPHAPGGDSVTWIYAGPGAGYGGCPVHDAGAFQDGAFPPPDDATTDILAIPPEGGATSQ